jgi:hypothetical protein
MIEQYYKGVSTINFQNRVRADKVHLKRNILTKDWVRRFNLSIFGMICVNASLFYQHIVHNGNKKGSYCEFFGSLADELINNTQGICMTRTAVKNQAAEAMEAAKPPTLRWMIRVKKRKGKEGVKEGVSQDRCRLKGCKVNSSHVCSKCTHPLDSRQKQFWLCNHTTRGGSKCWKEHLRAVHEIDI